MNEENSIKDLSDNLELMNRLNMQQGRAFNIVSNLIKNLNIILETRENPKNKLKRIKKELKRVEEDIFFKGRGTWSIIIAKTNFKMMCSNCNVKTNIEIHHINGNQKNNKVENLIPLCRSCHQKAHNNELIITEEMWENIKL